MVVAFIGIGNMGSALAKGHLARRPEAAASVRVFDVDAAKAARFCEANGGTACRTVEEAVQGADSVVLAMKPQGLPDALARLSPLLGKGTALVSIAAGIPLARLRALAGPAPAIARAMPNLCALVERSVTAVAFDGADAQVRGEVLRFFEGVGLALAVDEGQMDAVTGLSGSGPAYAFVLIEAFADAGVRLGLPRDAAIRMAAATLEGAGRMVLETGLHPAALKDQVCSPGGTTIEGVRALEDAGFRAAAIAAVSASAARAKELAGKG